MQLYHIVKHLLTIIFVQMKRLTYDELEIIKNIIDYIKMKFQKIIKIYGV